MYLVSYLLSLQANKQKALQDTFWQTRSNQILGFLALQIFLETNFLLLIFNHRL